MERKKFGKLSKLLVSFNKSFTVYIHNIIEEFADEETTQQEKTELLATIGGGIYMLGSNLIGIITAAITLVTLLASPIKSLMDASSANAAQIVELKRLKEELKQKCEATSIAAPTAPKTE